MDEKNSPSTQNHKEVVEISVIKINERGLGERDTHRTYQNKQQK